MLQSTLLLQPISGSIGRVVLDLEHTLKNNLPRLKKRLTAYCHMEYQVAIIKGI